MTGGAAQPRPGAAAGWRRRGGDDGAGMRVVVGRGRRSRARWRRRGAAVKAQGSEVSKGIFLVPAGLSSAGGMRYPAGVTVNHRSAPTRARGAPHRSKSARRGAEEGGDTGAHPPPPGALAQ